MLDEKDGALAASVASAARVPSFSLQLGGAKERVKKLNILTFLAPLRDWRQNHTSIRPEGLPPALACPDFTG